MHPYLYRAPLRRNRKGYRVINECDLQGRAQMAGCRFLPENCIESFKNRNCMHPETLRSGSGFQSQSAIRIGNCQ
jgi:hypothetical protein